MNDVLKPCPFCGSTNLNVTEESSYVMCYGCDADGPVTRPSAAAIAAWNNRAAPVPPAGGEPEVLAWRAHGFNFSTEAMAYDYNKWAEVKQPVQYLVDRAHVTRLQAENAALQQRLNVADQRVDELQHQLSQSLEVNPHSLRVVLTALVGAPHEIRELQACRGMPDNPIDQLLREYNAWIETPEPATPQ